MMLIRIFLFFFFSLVSLSAFSEAQLPATPDQQGIVKKTPTDAEIMHQLFLSIESLELNIKVKFKELYTLKGEERELQGVRILGLDKEIKNEIESAVSLLQEMMQQGSDVSESFTSTKIKHKKIEISNASEQGKKH